MFTGIVQARGQIAAVKPNPFGVRLVVDRSAWQMGQYQPAHGDSICVSGVCLTLVESDAKTFSFDVIAETLAKTTLGALVIGSSVNLEPSLTLNTPLGGHFMQGHVDGVGTITRLHAGSDEWRFTITPPAALMDYIVPKGSIAIDGVSLTIAAAGRTDFQVALIPTTLQITTLGQAQQGQKVNLEADILAKTVVHYLRRTAEGSGGLTLDKLRDTGFLI